MKRNSKFKIQDSKLNQPPTPIPQSPSVAFLWDESFLWGIMAYRALRNLDLPFDLIRSDDIKNGCLDKYGLLFVPGGWASNKGKALGDKGTEAIRKFVESGGNYLGFCGGAGLATLDGIGLLNIKRKPTKQRVPSFSGRIFLNVKEHPMWGYRGNPPWLPLHGEDNHGGLSLQGEDNLRLPRAGTGACPYHAWWPSQFLIEDSGINILATYGDALADSFSSDLNTGDTGANGNWAGLEKVYGINLDPGRLRNEPAVVEGRYGKGKVVLSLVHFDTPDDANGQQVLKNLWEYLLKAEGRRQKADNPPIPPLDKGGQRGGYSEFCRGERPFAPASNSSLINELETAIADLISLGERNFLWFWRNSMLLQWRRGVRGLEYCTLYVMIKEMKKAISSQPSVVSQENIVADVKRIGNLLGRFTEKAKRLLVLERHAMQKGHITYERCDDPEIRKMRAELFGESKSHGGMFKELVDEIDDLLFMLLRQPRY